MRYTDPDDRVPWERLLAVVLAVAALVTLACATPLEARQCPRGWRWISRVDTAGWVTRQNGDTLPITIWWDGCFEEET